MLKLSFVLAVCLLIFQVQVSSSWNLNSWENNDEKIELPDQDRFNSIDNLSDKPKLTFNVIESSENAILLAICNVDNFNYLTEKRIDYVVSFFRTGQPLVKQLLGQYEVFAQIPENSKKSNLFYRNIISNTEIAKGPAHTLPSFELTITNYPENQTENYFLQNYWCEIDFDGSLLPGNHFIPKNPKTNVVSNIWVQIPIVTLSMDELYGQDYGLYTCTVDHFSPAEFENSTGSFSVAFYYDFEGTGENTKLVGIYKIQHENGKWVVEFASAKKYDQILVKHGPNFEYPVYQLVIEPSRKFQELFCKFIRDDVPLNGSTNWQEVVSNAI